MSSTRRICAALAVLGLGACVALEPGTDRLTALDAAAISDSSAVDSSNAPADATTDASTVDGRADDAASADATDGLDDAEMDAAEMDAAELDGTAMDATAMDGTATDATAMDATAMDALAGDAAPADAAPNDASPADAGLPRDSGPRDTGSFDALAPIDSGMMSGDAGFPASCYPPNAGDCMANLHCDTINCQGVTTCRVNGSIPELGSCTPGMLPCGAGLICVPNLGQCRRPCDTSGTGVPCPGAQTCIEAFSCGSPAFNLIWGYCA